MGKKNAAEPVKERSVKVKAAKVKTASNGTKENSTLKEDKSARQTANEELAADISRNGSKTIEVVPPTPINGHVNLKKSLQDFFGFDGFKGEQERVLESVMSGHDTFVIMPTGGGKSLCYQLPALISEGTAIIISPLIA